MEETPLVRGVKGPGDQSVDRGDVIVVRDDTHAWWGVFVYAHDVSGKYTKINIYALTIT